MSEFNENTVIFGVKAAKIAGVIDAEGSVFAKDCYNALLAIAQTMVDMTESGSFGNSLEKVLEYHFCKGNERYDPRCLQAVEDVFVKGKRRNADWRIYQFRSFAKYAAEDGSPDGKKLASLFESYDYLGKDGISPRWGHFYFGKKKLYRVQVGAYVKEAGARRLYEQLRAQGYDAALCKTGRYYKLRVGRFFSKENAEKQRALLIQKGYADAFVTYCF